MELEYTVNGTLAIIMMVQTSLVAGLLVPAAVGRPELYEQFLSSAASYVISIAPVATLVYLLCRISQWQ